jgi:hypothetical protein
VMGLMIADPIGIVDLIGNGGRPDNGRRLDLMIVLDNGRGADDC